MSRLGLALVLVATCAAPCLAARSSDGRSRVVRHKVKKGQTMARLALKYYQDRDRFEILARVNGIDPPYRLKTGRIVRIPLSSSYTVKSGDTPSGIAQKQFGGASRYSLLMEMNNLPARGPLRRGQKLEIPAVMNHKLGRGETLGGVAKRYYGNASRVSWIADFNGISRPDRVKRGTRLKIPLTGFLPGRTASKPKSKASARKSPPPASKSQPARKSAKSSSPSSTPKKVARNASGENSPDPAVQRAVDHYHQGDYRQAAQALDRVLEKGSLERDERARALRFRAYCAVATGDARTAARTFLALHEVAPAWKPDSTLDSPKIRRAFARAISSPGP
ncbi:MAG: LysM peptidoglycan-binding domain-containing protein [Acidobacteriota bacterium]